MTSRSLCMNTSELPGRLTIGLLRDYIPRGELCWISLEPRAWLPMRNGKRLSGRLDGLVPLGRTLPEGLDDLPLLSATLYQPRRWQHFHDAQALSHIPGRCITWSLDPLSEAFREIEGIECKQHCVMLWQDLKRFDWPPESRLAPNVVVEHYYRQGERITWRIIPTDKEAEA